MKMLSERARQTRIRLKMESRCLEKSRGMATKLPRRPTQEITTTARDLSIVKTNAGRARAWLRLATMQKKLGDYVKVLVEQREFLLAEYYEPEALLVSEEGVLLTGLLVSLNIVDCNLCLKDGDLDCQEGVIDLSRYLRRKEDIGREGEAVLDEVEERDIATVMDQKNYIEEMNRNLAANVTNLQARVETLTTSNALMREDLAISKRKVESLEEEQESLQGELERQTNMAQLTRAAQQVWDNTLLNSVKQISFRLIELQIWNQRLSQKQQLKLRESDTSGRSLKKSSSWKLL